MHLVNRNGTGRARRQIGLITSLAVAVATVSVSSAGTVDAAPQSRNFDLVFSGSTTKQVLEVPLSVCDYCIPDIVLDDPDRTGEEFGLGAEATVNSTLEWTASATNVLSYNDSLLRQGQTLDTTNTLTPGAGTVKVRFGIDYALGVYERHSDFGGEWVQTNYTSTNSKQLLAATIPCSLPLEGQPPTECSGATSSLPIVTIPLVPGVVDVGLALEFNFTVEVDGSGIATVRKAEVLGGSSVASDTIVFEAPVPAVVADPLVLACGQPVGNDLAYSLTENSYSADVDLELDIALAIAASGPLFDESWPLASATIPLFQYPTIAMTAPSVTEVLGPVQVDNLPPVANPGGSAGNVYVGNEGSPIAFDGTDSSDNCGLPSLRWDFSDGGVAYGPSPSRSFADNGVYTGQLRATDAAGNTSTAPFTVVVDNVAPIADAGPDTTSAWGKVVTFNGYAADSGAGDLATLKTSWSFGDGSPSASGGASTTHVYATPGNYTATLTVCDKDGACTSDTRTVHVTTRATTLAYNGSVSGLPKKESTVKANVTDEFGQPVAGRSVTFTIGTQSVTAITDGAGTAVGKIKLTQKTGNYTVIATYTGDAKYTSSTDSAAFRIGK
jgi:hypothetical protein